MLGKKLYIGITLFLLPVVLFILWGCRILPGGIDNNTVDFIVTEAVVYSYLLGLFYAVTSTDNNILKRILLYSSALISFGVLFWSSIAPKELHAAQFTIHALSITFTYFAIRYKTARRHPNYILKP